VNKTVLIIDDNVSLAYFSARNLERDVDGIQVSTANSCAEAREAVRANPPAVLVADIKLTDGNGLDLVSELSEQIPGLESIVISGELPSQAPKPGIRGFLLKPYEAQALVNMVQKALSQNGSHTDAAPHAPAVPDQCLGYDRHRAQNRLADVLLGLRAFAADLKSESNHPEAVERLVDEYVDQLCQGIKEVSSLLPVCPKKS
jgi:DNA-binding NtrC family response regulator